jgi:hypothetical protein
METFNAPPWNESWRVDDALQRLRDVLATPRSHGVCVSASDGELLGFALGRLERSGPEDHFLLKEMCGAGGGATGRSGRMRMEVDHADRAGSWLSADATIADRVDPW